jgi:hypothetical protein
MWAHPFNHLAAVAAAKVKAAELRARKRMLVLAKLTVVANRGEMAKRQQQLETRRHGLEQFIDDPYPADSLFRILFDRDRRAILEAGRSLQAPVLA